MSLTPKGEARRDAILDAALRVLERDGVASVTHRAVASEAGVPLASATYYFASLDDLYLSALRRATASISETLAGLGEHDIAAFARVLYGWAHDERPSTVAQYELMFLAMRRDSLRTDAEAWYRALSQAIDPENLHPARTRVTALAVDGLLLKMLWLGEPGTLADTEAALAEIVNR